jgi:hypothetical protein
LAPSRLEHYSIPALPGVVLLAGRVWQRAEAGDLGASAWRAIAVIAGAIVAVGVVGIAYGATLLARTYWIAEAPDLLALARPAASVLAVGGLLALVASVRRRVDVLVATLAVAMVALVGIVLRAEVAAEPLFSWRPIANVLTASVAPDTEVVFESPEEYQIVGGLVFYARRRITLLEPPGFVPPTYLVDLTDSMFLARGEFERRWRAGERLAFVSDSQRRRDDPHGLVPDPFHVIGRFGDRWVLSNVPSAG